MSTEYVIIIIFYFYYYYYYYNYYHNLLMLVSRNYIKSSVHHVQHSLCSQLEYRDNYIHAAGNARVRPALSGEGCRSC